MIPPIRAVAIGPKKLLRSRGISAARPPPPVRRNGPEPPDRGADDGFEAAVAREYVLLDLVDQDDGIAHDDPEHRNRSSMATKPNGMCSSRSAITTPIKPSGAVRITISTRLKLCNCSISRTRTAISSKGICSLMDACAFPFSSHGATDLNPVAHGKLFAQLRERRVNLVGDIDALRAVLYVSLDCYGGLTIALPDHNRIRART